MTVAEVLPRLVVQDPGGVDSLCVRRDCKPAGDALVEVRPVDLVLGKHALVDADRVVDRPDDTRQGEPGDLVLLRE